MRQNKRLKSYLCVAIVTALFVTSFYMPGNVKKTKASGYGLSNPTIERDVIKAGEQGGTGEGALSNPLVKATVTTWDCIYFGNYWQNDTNGDGIVDQKDEKQPIKWRVLSVDGDDAFLLADQNLDCQPYNEVEEAVDVTWETCTLRNWLNSTFLSNAFSSEEQSAIKDTTVVNADNPEFGTDGGKDTTDKVYLLSIAETSHEEYGFACDSEKESKTREAKNTAYAKACGAWTDKKTDYEGNGNWWLRSPGFASRCAADVDNHGDCAYGDNAYYDIVAIRPVLHLNLSSSGWEVAEKVTVGDISSSTWDCVSFGNYWKNDTNGDGTVDKNDEKQPIKWRVLSVNGDDAFLLADQNLDCQPYNEENTGVTWETCTLRSWLNSTFLSNAFSSDEQSAIKNTMVVNEDNWFGIYGGKDTTDKVYLLSIAEASYVKYGFDREFDKRSEAREAENTAYANACGAYVVGGGWWLRSLGCDSAVAALVNEDGRGYDTGLKVNNGADAVRPALHLDLSSSLWKPAGKVTVEKENSSSGQEPAPTKDPAEKPTPTMPQAGNPIVTQTQNPSSADLPSPAHTPSPSVIPSGMKGKRAVIKSAKNKKGKKAVIRWKRVKGAAGYQITYATNKKFKKKKTRNVAKTTVTLKKLKKKKTYYIKVRAYALTNGKKVYGKWSKVKKVKVRK